MMNVRKIILALTALFVTISIKAQQQYDKDSLIDDFDHYVKLLKQTHPDPYTAYGGRVFFHKKVNGMKESLAKQTSLTPDQLADSINSLTATLEDGHTFIYNPKGDSRHWRYVNLLSTLTGGKLSVGGIDQKYKYLLGASIDSINGVKTEDVAKLVGRTQNGCENIIGCYFNLTRLAQDEQFLSRLPHPDGNDYVRYSLTDVNGTKIRLTLKLMTPAEDNDSIVETPEWKDFPGGYFQYKFMDAKKQIMLINIPKIMARENFEYALKHGLDGTGNEMKNFFKYTLRKDMPADTAKALRMIPSFSETFASMLKEMKKHKSETLIIDLSSNSGGWTPITLPTLLMIYGKEYLDRHIPMEYTTRLSHLYLKKNNITIEKFNKENGTKYEIGDFVFESESNDSTTENTDKLSTFIKKSMCDTKLLLTKLKGKPLYRPKNVYVITDIATFSAAFHYAYYLSCMGATIVGEPCRQAPNTFMEVTPFTLPYSKLKGSISNAMQICYPANDRRAKVFRPDIQPTYNDYKHYDFDRYTTARWLIDRLERPNR